MNKIMIAIELLKLARIIAKFIKSQKEAEHEIEGVKQGSKRLDYVLREAQDFLTQNEKQLVESMDFKELSDLVFRNFTSQEA